ncbi:dihydrodipicolinate synthetase [Coprinellus micaceus]|uniref:Dihydrodipicolinate synthetase n=1 Tax=Coprinellus micaceus TaxID=71717 RepID=A0A4Y7TQD3_COPMI|nr:dihydrodipicolinate synthetase [Coprinellus micaceus]
MGLNGVVNGHHVPSRPLKAGIYAPIPTFFLKESEDLDISSFEGHVARVAAAGVYPLIAGTMGEAHHLSHSERTTLIRAARRVLDNAGLAHFPLIAGTGAGSTRETIEVTKEAAEAGADYAIVICSGYFAGVLASNRHALKDFWSEVAEKSPIPVMIYNYPGASGGIDLDSDLVTDLAISSPNLCGVKLTCGNVGKLTRLAEFISSDSFVANYPRKNSDAPFLILGGFADFLLPSAFVEGHGAITGLANLIPNTLIKLYELSEAARKDISLLPAAQNLQGLVARADYTIAKAGISGTKYLLQKLYGYGGDCRKPLPAIDPTAGDALWEHPHTQAVVSIERELTGKTKA